MDTLRTYPRAAFLVVLVSLLASGPAHAQSRVIGLVVGQQRVLTIHGATKASIGNQSIASVVGLHNQLILTGLAAGRTSLMVWLSNGRRLSYLVNVTAQDVRELVKEIKELLGDIEGVTIRIVGDRVFLDGQAYTTDDFQRIKDITKLYPQVKSFVRIAPNAKKLVANALNQEFQKSGLKNVQANVVGTTIFLEGSVESKQDMQKALLITKALGEKVQNLLTVGIKRMILTEVQFVEIRKQGLDNVGIAWPFDITGALSGGISINQSLPGFPATKSGIWTLTGNAGSKLAFGMTLSDGYGRLLAQPKLVCASGEKASFLAGGQVPIPMITANQMSVTYKPYGIRLRIQPTADRHGNIQVQIFAEVSEIDDSVSVKIGSNINIPGFRTRNVSTNVTVRHGETIVLSGVFNHDEEKTVSKFPLLGNIPIIGELWKSRQFKDKKSELVIFVTPRIVNPDTERIRRTIADIKTRYKQAADQVHFSIFD